MDTLFYQFIGGLSTFVLVIGFFIWTLISVTKVQTDMKELRKNVGSNVEDIRDRMDRLEYATYQKEVKKVKEDILKELAEMEKKDAQVS